MTHTVTMRDEILGGSAGKAADAATLTLDFLTTHITARELIRRRVIEEVALYNRTMPEYFRGLVQPTDAERTLNGYRPRPHHTIDAEAQVVRALDAFARNGFFLLVDDRQIESLDQEITLRVQTDVCFVKLMPLIGG